MISGAVNTLRCTRNTPSSRLSSTRLSSAVCSMVGSSYMSDRLYAQELLTDLGGKFLQHRLGLLADHRLAKFPNLAEQVGFHGDAHFGLDRSLFAEIHAQMRAYTATQAPVLGISPHSAMPLLPV